MSEISESVSLVKPRIKPLIYFGGALLVRLGGWSLGVAQPVKCKTIDVDTTTTRNRIICERK